MLELEPSRLESELANLINVSWVVLIPLGVLLSLVIYKLLVILQSVYEFWMVARHELSPAMADLRKTANHVEILTGKAVEGIETVERGVNATTPILNKGVFRLQQAALTIKGGVMGIVKSLQNR